MKKLITSKSMKTTKECIERIFIEEPKIKDTKFVIGSKYTYVIDNNKKIVSIKATETSVTSSNKVKISKKEKGNHTVIPVIDIKHNSIKNIFNKIKECVVKIYEDEIIIEPLVNSTSELNSRKIINLFKKNPITETIVIKKEHLTNYLKMVAGDEQKESILELINKYDYNFSTDCETTSYINTIENDIKAEEELNYSFLTSMLLSDFTYFESFAGSGLGGKALDNHGAKNIGFSEIDKHAILNYNANFKGRYNYGDITEVDSWNIPDFDILIGGPPCKDFSIMKRAAGNVLKGLKGKFSSLFYHFAKLLNKKKPKWFIMENVKNILSVNNGEDFKEIVTILEENYNIKYKIMETSKYGIPQKRSRVYTVGQLKSLGESFDFQFPKPMELKVKLKDILEDLVAEKYFLTEKMKKYVMSEGTKTFKQKPKVNLDIARTLTETMHKCHRAGTDTYIQVKKAIFKNKSDIRRLTPTECIKIQGILDNSYNLFVSDTQAYRLMGNAMSYNVVSAIAYNLGLYIKENF